ncbi:MAG: helix-turn-helix domain-containing protein [Candidatus Binatia bacterium]
MDLSKPISSLIPGATGKALEVLAASRGELSLRTLASLADVSPSQASRVLARLVELGIVSRRDVPPVSLFRLNREHLAAPALEDLRRSAEALPGRIGELSTAISPPPVTVTLFGSAAESRATASSDIDVLVVRSEDVDPADASWSTSLADFMESVERLTGNTVNVLEVGEGELPELLSSPAGVWRAIATDGVTVAGRPLRVAA